MPRRGIDKPGQDLFWLEFEDEEVRSLLPSGKVVLFFREGWANKSLPLVNKNGTMDLGDTSLMTEVHRTMRDSVSVKWPENLRHARFLWFSPGAKPQCLGTFDSSLGERRRLEAELAPVLDHLGTHHRCRWIENAVLIAVILVGVWIGNSIWPEDSQFLVRFRKLVLVSSAVAWLGIITTALWQSRGWDANEYGSFVLHDKYRFKNPPQ